MSMTVTDKEYLPQNSETAYLLRAPANARKLISAIDELEADGGSQEDLKEAKDGQG